MPKEGRGDGRRREWAGGEAESEELCAGAPMEPVGRSKVRALEQAREETPREPGGRRDVL
jgi:hypothetical protein